MTWPRKLPRGMMIAALVISVGTLCCKTPEAQGADPQAQYQLGFSYFQRRDYANACKYFQQAAAQGDVASQSMIQMVDGYGYHCAMPMARARTAPSSLPDILQLYAGASQEARSWHGDAILTFAQVSNQAHPGYYTTTFLFVSRSARQVLSLVDSQLGGPVGKLTGRTDPTPLPGGFVSLAAAVEQAHRAGMKGAIDNATLTIWQGSGGSRLPGWLLHAPASSFQTFLIGALDGKIYPVSRYSYPVQGNDQQIRAMRQSASRPPSSAAPRPQRGNPCSSSGMASMSERLSWFTPCNQAALRNLYRQSSSNYDM